jgi:hypothetical protein
MGKNVKSSKILGGCNFRKGKDLHYCPGIVIHNPMDYNFNRRSKLAQLGEKRSRQRKRRAESETIGGAPNFASDG